MKKQLSILLLLIVSLSYGQERDTVWLQNETRVTGELISSLLGKDAKKTIKIQVGGNVQKYAFEEIKKIKNGPVVFKPIRFKVGKEEFKTIANQYYFGHVNFYHAKIAPFGSIHLIEKNGIVQLLTVQNAQQVLIAAFENCFSNGIVKNFDRIETSDLIRLADAYHACSQLKGRSEIRKSYSKSSFALRVGLDMGISSNVNFRSRQFRLLLNSDELISNYTFENERWDTQVLPTFSTGVFYKLSNLKLELGTLLRYLNYHISKDNYNVAPFDDPDVYSKVDFGFNKVELGFSILFVPSQQDYIPYLRFTTYRMLNYRFNFSEERFDSIDNPNDGFEVIDKKGRSFSLAIGSRRKNLSAELGYHITQGAMEIVGPSYDANNFSNTILTGYDSGGYELSQFHLTLLYDFQLGKAKEKFIIHR